MSIFEKMKIPRGPVAGAFALGAYAVNTIFWFIPLSAVATLKLSIPVDKWRKFCDRVLTGIANSWISVNNRNIEMTSQAKWDISGLDSLQKDQWYLVLSNHRSWADILVLQKVFHRKIPFLKFFIKKSMIWMPLLGVTWWAMDFPFMKRYSKKTLAKKPHLKGKDLEITKKACEKFKNAPVSIMNFVEGTRFTLAKRATQGSPYAHLLRPKSGGIAFVLGAMGEQLHRVVNVTISYPQGAGSFWDFVCGKMDEIRISVEALPIGRDLLGDYFNDPEHREKFQIWLNNVWLEKDRQLKSMLALPAPEGVAEG